MWLQRPSWFPSKQGANHRLRMLQQNFGMPSERPASIRINGTNCSSAMNHRTWTKIPLFRLSTVVSNISLVQRHAKTSSQHQHNTMITMHIAPRLYTYMSCVSLFFTVILNKFEWIRTRIRYSKSIGQFALFILICRCTLLQWSLVMCH